MGFKSKLHQRYTKLYGDKGEAVVEKMFDESVKACRSVSSLYEFDEKVLTPYNNLKKVSEYYDILAADPTKFHQCRVLNVHALDDPLISSECMVYGCDPQSNAVEAKKHKSIMLLTESGGHLGWVRNSLYDGKSWKFMHDVSFSFFNASSAYGWDEEMEQSQERD